jgi:5-methylcytosine-specific restriction endonuclease McrA
MPAKKHLYNRARWKRLRRSVLERDRWRCYWCGRALDRVTPRAAQVDHVTAVALGGQAYDPANLVASCMGCNGRRGQETLVKLQAAGRRSAGGAGFVGYGESVREGAIRLSR